MKIPRKLLDLYPRPAINGIFYFMSKSNKFTDLFTRLGMTSEQEIHSMDLDYVYNHSGLKTLSILMNNIISQYTIDDNSNYVTDPDGNRITFKQMVDSINTEMVNIIIYNKFYDKWSKLVDTLSYDYDALSPYQMEIEENGSATNVRNVSDSNSYENTADNTDTSNEDLQQNSNRYGFDSEDAVPTDVNTNKNTTTTTGNTTGKGSASRTSSEDNKELTGRNITRKGNIGNRSMQELIEQQRELLRYQIFDVIYEDLDSVLTRSRYYI